MEHESLRMEEVTNAIIKIFNPLTPGSERVKNAPTTMYVCCRTNRILNLKNRLHSKLLGQNKYLSSIIQIPK